MSRRSPRGADKPPVMYKMDLDEFDEGEVASDAKVRAPSDEEEDAESAATSSSQESSGDEEEDAESAATSSSQESSGGSKSSSASGFRRDEGDEGAEGAMSISREKVSEEEDSEEEATASTQNGPLSEETVRMLKFGARVMALWGTDPHLTTVRTLMAVLAASIEEENEQATFLESVAFYKKTICEAYRDGLNARIKLVEDEKKGAPKKGKSKKKQGE
jgi:hypothetical protein